MNEQARTQIDRGLEYQTVRFQELLAGMVHCCEERMAHEARRLGLPHSEMECLRLFNGEKYLTVKGMAQRMGVAKSRVTKIVEGLAAKDLVIRTDDPNDGRSRLISLTPAGKSKSREIEDIIKENHRQVMLNLTPDERKSSLAALEILRASMEAVKADQD